MRITVNGRFRSRAVTGVERYALEVLSRAARPVEYIEPKRPAVGLQGHWWEQAVLPWRFRGDVLWSPCNTGPLAVKRQVVTLHDCAFLDHPECFSRMFAAWYQWLLPRLARSVAAILTVSHYSKQRIVECLRVPENKVRVIANGVNQTFRPIGKPEQQQVRERLGLPARYVLTVGSREPRKNLAGLIAAWKLAAPEMEEVDLVVVGAKNLRTFRGDGVTDDAPRVHYTGYLDHADLPAVYSAAEVFVYPSLYEGFGLPVLEAMACGTPVVCSKTTSLPEVAGDAARLIDPLSPEDIAAALVRLVSHPAERARGSELGLARAEQFSWDRSAAQTWDVLDSIARENLR